ncbi:response regulator transcription factor [Paracoccaceae bacterium Fryx2]|nr:response regulator transcription factor [Paracoccaceae bacterium Fryx2]
MTAVIPMFENAGAQEHGIVTPRLRTIVVCDDNPVLSEGIRLILMRDAYLSNFVIIVDAAPDLAAMKKLAPDILIIDPWQRLEPGAAVSDAFLGLSDVTSLIGYCPEIAPIEARALGLLGFRGIMPKTVQSEELVRIVCAVTFGGVYLHEGYTDHRTPSPVQAGQEASLSDLTERECEVLRHVALGSSMKEIAALLHISTKTVDTYKNRANRKLNLRSRSDIVRYAIQSGWMQ